MAVYKVDEPEQRRAAIVAIIGVLNEKLSMMAITEYERDYLIEKTNQIMREFEGEEQKTQIKILDWGEKHRILGADDASLDNKDMLKKDIFILEKTLEPGRLAHEEPLISYFKKLKKRYEQGLFASINLVSESGRPEAEEQQGQTHTEPCKAPSRHKPS